MKKIVILISLLFSTGIGLWLARPAYQGWNQKRFLAQAQAAFLLGDFTNATFSARKTLDLNARNPDACRLMAQIAEKLQSPQAIAWRARVVELAPDAGTNRLELARTALRFGNGPQANVALQGITDTASNTADFHLLASMVAVGRNDFSSAEEHCAEAVRQEPTNSFARFNLAVLQLKSSNTTLHAAATQTLQELSADPVHRRDALRNLAAAAHRQTNLVAALALSRQLLAEPPIAFSDRLAHLRLLKEVQSQELVDYLASLEVLAAQNVNDLSNLGSWLRAERMSDEALHWLLSLPPQAPTDRAATELIAACYADQGGWTNVQRTLENSNWGDQEFIRLSLLARAHRELHQKFGTRSDWLAALNAASGRRQALFVLLDMAKAWHWNDELDEVAWRIILEFPAERQVLALLEKNYAATGNTPGLLKVYAELMKYDSPDAVAKNNFAAIALLLNRQMEEAHETARENFRQHPQDGVILSTYAFSLHQQGKTGEGLKLLEQLKPDELRQPGIAAYYGVLLAAAGQTNSALEYLNLAAQAAQLLPEEKNLIAGARALVAPKK